MTDSAFHMRTAGQFVARHAVIGMASFLAPIVGAWAGMRIASLYGADTPKLIARLSHVERFRRSERENVLARAIEDGQTELEAKTGVHPELDQLEDFQEFLRHKQAG